MRVSRFPRVAAVSLLAASAVAVATPAVAATAAISPDLVHIHPTASHVGSAQAAPPTTAQCESQFKIACYGAQQIQQAYDLPALFKKGTEGQGQTIAIVDSFGSPTIQADLDTFDKAYGLPGTNVKVIQPAGAVAPWDPTNG